MGPNRKQMPDGSVQYHYDGIQVRKVPLPLRVPLQAQSQSQQQQPQQQIIKTLPNLTQQKQQQQQSQPHINNNAQPQQRLPSVLPVSTTTVSSTTSSSSPTSPILTHLLHRKNEAPNVDPKVIFDFIQISGIICKL